MARRHLITAVTLLVLVGLLGLGLVVGMKTLFAPFPAGLNSPAAAVPSPTCSNAHVRKGQRLHSTQVVVSVYNAGTRSGLADKTLAALAKRGFKTGEAGNAPSGSTVHVVQVWTTETHDAAAVLVARQFGHRAVVRVVKKDLSDGVDVLVGDGFHGHLAKAKKSILVRSRQLVCS